MDRLKPTSKELVLFQTYQIRQERSRKKFVNLFTSAVYFLEWILYIGVTGFVFFLANQGLKDFLGLFSPVPIILVGYVHICLWLMFFLFAFLISEKIMGWVDDNQKELKRLDGGRRRG